MANATNADECRLLMDMFLAQSGYPMNAAEFTPDSSLEPTEEQQGSVVEALLSHGEPATEKRPGNRVSVNCNVDTGAALEPTPPTPRSNSHSPVASAFVQPDLSGAHDAHAAAIVVNQAVAAGA